VLAEPPGPGDRPDILAGIAVQEDRQNFLPRMITRSVRNPARHVAVQHIRSYLLFHARITDFQSSA
jgi:hypothetical protein